MTHILCTMGDGELMSMDPLETGPGGGQIQMITKKETITKLRGNIDTHICTNANYGMDSWWSKSATLYLKKSSPRTELAEQGAGSILENDSKNFQRPGKKIMNGPFRTPVLPMNVTIELAGWPMFKWLA